MLTHAEILQAARNRRLTCINFGYHLDGKALYGVEDQAVCDLLRADLLAVERSIWNPEQFACPVVLTPAGLGQLVTAPYSSEVQP